MWIEALGASAPSLWKIKAFMKGLRPAQWMDGQTFLATKIKDGRQTPAGGDVLA
jgi:hypothetical protein